MEEIKNSIVKCLKEEADSILSIAEYLDEKSVLFAQKIAQCQGKLFFTGVGKSYIVEQRLPQHSLVLEYQVSQSTLFLCYMVTWDN